MSPRIVVGVVTHNKSTTGSVQFRVVGDHNGVENPENDKVGYGSQGSDMALAGVGTHNNWQPGTRLFGVQFAEDGSYGLLGSFPRHGSPEGGGGSDKDSKNDTNYKQADTPIDFKNPGPDGPNTDNEMDKPSGRYNKYAGGKGFDSSSFKFGPGSSGLAPYKDA